jgi:peptidoglycan-N-acetylglucosamine deacetylase
VYQKLLPLKFSLKLVCLFFGPLLLLSFPGFIMAQPDQPASQPANSTNCPVLTFGSQIVLTGCWSEAELQGTSAEKKSSLQKSSPARPPQTPSLNKNPLPTLPQELQNSIRSVKPTDGRKLIALTFDLCEAQGEIAGYDAEIIDFLRSAKTKATFFAGGKWLQSHPHRAMQLMADPLFEIGNHSWNHPNFRLISETAMQEQIVRTQAQYEIIWENLARKVQTRDLDGHEMHRIPKVPLTFRFPYGTCSATALRVTAAQGLPAIQWNIVTADSCKTQTAEKIARTIINRAQPGAIVIMHANGKGVQTARALPLFFPVLLNQGYQFVTVSELLQAGPVVSTATCYEVKPNDNVRYDRINRKK